MTKTVILKKYGVKNEKFQIKYILFSDIKKLKTELDLQF